MKTLIILTLLISNMVSAVTLKTADLASSHPDGALGVASFLEHGGWMSQQQRQQQQYAQQPRCNVRQSYGSLWYYSEAFYVDEIIKTEKFISARHELTLSTAGKNALAQAVDELAIDGAKAVRLTCQHSRYAWTFWEYIGNQRPLDRTFDVACLRMCEENRAPNCKEMCSRVVIDGKKCEIPSYVGTKGADIYCELTIEE